MQKGKTSLNVYVVILAGAAVIWLALFRYFFATPESLVLDAGVYYEHVKYYLDNIAKGIYPLWDPFRDQGAANGFYLRRIGEFNPAYWFVVVSHALGLATEPAYKIFLGLYFLTGIAGFYLLSRRLFADPRAALTAALLLMFSSLGMEVFSSYVILMVVPGIWFFYFLVAFVQGPARVHLLGLSFCLMLLLVTYIPFFFISILGVFVVCAGVVYGPVLGRAFKAPAAFCRTNKGFSLFCAFAVACSLLPGILWYQASCQREGVITHRNDGLSTQADMTHVALRVVNEGGINSALIVDALGAELERKKPGDFYVPLFALLLVAAGCFTALNRRQVLLFLWGFIVFLIGSADACGLHGFLYKHVFLFRFFRNLHFYLPLLVLPVFILFAAGILDAAIKERGSVRRRHGLAAFIVAVHAAAAYFFVQQEDGLGLTTGLTLAASLALLLVGLYVNPSPGKSWVLGLLLVAIVAQPVGVFSHLKLFHRDNYLLRTYEGDYMRLKLPQDPNIEAFMKNANAPISLAAPYYATPWFHEIYGNVNRGVLAHYLGAKILLYDRIEPYDEATLDYKYVEQHLSAFANAALVPAQQAKDVPVTNGAPAGPRAELVPAGSSMLKVSHFSPNDVVLETNFATSKFLVYNTNFHSGWRVYCDGKPLPLLRANTTFQGVWIPAGAHVVHFHFGQAWQYALAWFMIALFTGVFLYVIWLACRKQT